MGIEEVLTVPRSPWQSPYVERIIGSIRRECLDHVIFFNETHLRLFSLLSQEENASVVEQRLSGPPSHPTAFGWQDPAACTIATNVAGPEPLQFIGRSRVHPFSTRFSRGAHRASGPSNGRGRHVRLLRMNRLRDPIDF